MLPVVAAGAEGLSLGVEWMPIASILIPLFLLILIVWLGSRNTV